MEEHATPAPQDPEAPAGTVEGAGAPAGNARRAATGARALDAGPGGVTAVPLAPRNPGILRFADAGPLRYAVPDECEPVPPPGTGGAGDPGRVPGASGSGAAGGGGDAGPGPAGRGPGRREEQAAALRVCGAVGLAVFEALAGVRPAHQLARWLDPDTYDKLHRRIELTHAALGGAALATYRTTTIRRARACRVAEGVFEVSLVLAGRARVRAAALRVERRRGQWRVCALELG